MQDFLPLALQVLGSTLAIAPAREGHYLRVHLVAHTPLLRAAVQLLCLSFAQKAAMRGGRKHQSPAPEDGNNTVRSASSPIRDMTEPPEGPQEAAAAAAAAEEKEEAQAGTLLLSEAQLERLRQCVRLVLQLLGNLVHGCDAAKVLHQPCALSALARY
jgi:hypothetical protein